MKAQDVLKELSDAGVKEVTLYKGVYTARWPFYWLAQAPKPAVARGRILDRLPEAIIEAYGTENKPFRGGASIREGSHVWVKFRLTCDIKTLK